MADEAANVFKGLARLGEPGDEGVAQAVEGPAPQTLEDAVQENARLRAELIRMRERESVLKKSLGILSETPESGMPRLKR